MLLQYALLLCTCMTHRSDKTFCVSIKYLNLIELLTLVYMCVYVHKHTYTYTCLFLILMLWHRQAIFESKETSCLPLLNAGFEPKVSDNLVVNVISKYTVNLPCHTNDINIFVNIVREMG